MAGFTCVNVKDEDGSEQEVTPDPTTPATPSKSGGKKRAKKNIDEDTPSKKTKTTGKKIPTSVDELSAEDRMLMQMRADGKAWAEITKAWETMSGTKVGGTTCRRRYSVLKANLARVEDAHAETMKQCFATVKEEIEQEKLALDKKLWVRIVEAMEQAGTPKYEAGTVEKACKQASLT